MLKRLLLKILREGIGGLMAFVSYIFSPRKIKRSPSDQKNAIELAQNMSIYQYFACPFCIKTRRAVRRLNIPIDYRDAQVRGSEHRNMLEKEGGMIKVPCLRIEENGQTTWMYESSDIIAYLNETFDPVLQIQESTES